MGDPSHFSVQGGANPHTRTWLGTRRSVDRALAIEQWKRLRDTLRDHGIRVVVLPPDPGQPGLVYPANAGFLPFVNAEKPLFEKSFFLSNLIATRAGERYRGEVEPIDPRAGHIPGAKSAPFGSNLTRGAAPVFRDPAELRAQYAALGADRVEPIVYCGSGITACHDLLALEVAGLRGRLYGGSWSEWSSDASLPVETGG